VGTVKKGAELLSREACVKRALRLGKKERWDAGDEGSFGLPLRLGSSVVVESLGSVKAEPGFSSRREVLPDGFRSCWEDIESRVLYTSEVLRGADSEGPVFRVTVSEVSQENAGGAGDVLVMYEGADPMDVWAQVEEPLASQMVKDCRDPFGLCSTEVVQRLEFLWASLPKEEREAEGASNFQFVGERGDWQADEVFRLKSNAKLLTGYQRERKELFKKAQKLQRDQNRVKQQLAKEARLRQAQKDAEHERLMVQIRAAVRRMVIKAEKICAAEERLEQQAQARAEKARKRQLQVEAGQMERPKRSRFDLRLEALQEMWQEEQSLRMDSALPSNVPLPEPAAPAPAACSGLPAETFETLLQAQDFVNRFGFCAGIHRAPSLKEILLGFAPQPGPHNERRSLACFSELYCCLLRIIIHEVTKIAEEAERRGLHRGAVAAARGAPIVVLHPLDDGSYCKSWNEVLRRVIFCLAPTEDGKPFCQRMPAEALQFLVDSGASSRAHIKKSLIVARCLEAAEALLPQGLFLEPTPGARSGQGGDSGVWNGGEPRRGVSSGSGSGATAGAGPPANVPERAGERYEAQGWQALAALLAQKTCRELSLGQQTEVLELLLSHLTESQLLKSLITGMIDAQAQTQAKLREARADLRRLEAERRLMEFQASRPGGLPSISHLLSNSSLGADSAPGANPAAGQGDGADEQDIAQRVLQEAKVRGQIEILGEEKEGTRATPLGSDRHGNMWIAVSEAGFFSPSEEEARGSGEEQRAASEACGGAEARLVIAVRTPASLIVGPRWRFYGSSDVDALLAFLSSETRNEGALRSMVVRLRPRIGRLSDVFGGGDSPQNGAGEPGADGGPALRPETVQRALQALESSLSKSSLKESGGPAGTVWRRAWRNSLRSCDSPARLASALIILEDKIKGEALREEWSVWSNSPVMPEDFAHLPAVMLRVQVMKNALEATWGRPGWRFLGDCEERELPVGEGDGHEGDATMQPEGVQECVQQEEAQGPGQHDREHLPVVGVSVPPKTEQPGPWQLEPEEQG